MAGTSTPRLLSSGLLALLSLTVIMVSSLAREVVVSDEKGQPVSGAHLMCIDPVGAVARADEQGLAKLDELCRWARCDADGYLGAEVDLSRLVPVCRLRQGLRISGSFPSSAPACAACEARIYREGAGAPLAVAAVHPERREAFRFPALAPGAYRLELCDDDAGWVCTTRLAPSAPGRLRVIADWRAPTRWRGVFRNAAGDPLPGAPLRLSVDPPEFGETRVVTLGRWGCARLASAMATTDDQGRFALDVDPGRESLLVLGDARSEGSGLARRILPAGPGGTLDLVARPTLFLRVQLVDREGQPQRCRARLTGLGRESRWSAALRGLALTGECDDEGVLELGPFPRGKATLELAPETGLALRLPLHPDPDEELIDLGVRVVERGERAALRVVDQSGRPIAGAQVVARVFAGIVLMRETRALADGTVRLTGLPEGARVIVALRAEGYQDASAELRGGDPEPLIVTLLPGRRVRGEIVSESGEAMPSSRVRILSKRDGSLLAEVDADENGRFEVTTLPPVPVRVSALASGYQVVEEIVADLGSEEVVAGLTVILAPRPRLEGHLIGRRGRPIAGGRVRLIERTAVATFYDARVFAEALSDAEGAFELPAAEDGQVLVASAEGYGPRVVSRLVGVVPHGLDIVLPVAARLRTHIPAACAPDAVVYVEDGAGIGWRRRVGEAHELVFGDLAPGPARARLVPGPERSLRLHAGEESELALDVGATLAGRVLHKGKGVPRAVVALAKLEGPDALWGPTTLSDAEGAFFFEGLPPGERLLVVESPRGRLERRLVLPTEGRLETELALEEYRIDVHLIDVVTGDDLPGAQVIARPEAFADRQPRIRGYTYFASSPWDAGLELSVSDSACDVETTDGKGYARLLLPAPGRHLLKVVLEGFHELETKVDVSAGCAHVELSLERRPARTVRALLETDPPGLAGELLCRSAGHPLAWSYVAVEGRCEGLPPGPIEVFFRVIDYGTARVVVKLPEQGEVEAKLRVLRGGVLVIPVADELTPRPQVIDENGVEWSDVLRQIDPPGEYQPALSDLPELGLAWVFPDLPYGVYTAFVDGRVRESIVVVPGEQSVAR